jgi:lipoate-protein ligase A
VTRGAPLIASVPAIAVRRVPGERVLLGAFQRAASALRVDEVRARGLAIARRRSGGPAIVAGPGSLHVSLSLPRHDALVPCSPAQIVNRHVRPLLAGLRRLGAPAHYFGRHVVDLGRRPVAFVGYAHHAATGATLFEAIVAVSRGLDLPRDLDAYPARVTDPFLGKTPATIEEVLGEPVSLERATESILAAYDAAYGALERPPADDDAPLPDDDTPPWDALREDAIGFVGAAAWPPALGGDLFASHDLLEALRDGIARAADLDAARRAVHEALASSGGTIDGLRDPTALADVAWAAAQGRVATQ